MGEPKKKPITVAALIAELQKLPPDAYLFTEGCDCEGPCDGVRQRVGDGKSFVLTRDDYAEWPE